LHPRTIAAASLRRCYSIICALLLSHVADAQEGVNNVRLNWGKASETDLTTAVFGDYEASPESDFMLGGSWGHRLSETMFGAPFELTGNLLAVV